MTKFVAIIVAFVALVVPATASARPLTAQEARAAVVEDFDKRNALAFVAGYTGLFEPTAAEQPDVHVRVQRRSRIDRIDRQTFAVRVRMNVGYLRFRLETQAERIGGVVYVHVARVGFERR